MVRQAQKTLSPILTGFEGAEARTNFPNRPIESMQTQCEQVTYTSEQRQEIWQKLLETDGCLGSWNKETGEWIPLL